MAQTALTLRATPAEKRLLEERAAREGCSVAELVREAIYRLRASKAKAIANVFYPPALPLESIYGRQTA